jgi:apolipoprotein D and lipocalin family protein
LKTIFVIISVLLSLSCKTQNNQAMINKTTITEFELSKYLGTWYEIARFPHSFEKDLIGVTATYSLRDDGGLKVLNQGYKKSFSGELKSAYGKAKVTSVPGKLKVSFFLFFYADYNILELDSANYQWVLIGSSTPNYLWILSRTPHIDKELYNNLIDRAKARGYEVSKLLLVPQR